MKNKEIEYGNISLGKINKMLISFIGESAFYYYSEEFAKEGLIDNWQSKEAFQKYINRLTAEEDSEFTGLNVANNSSIPVIVCKILDKFVSDYDCTPNITEQIKKLTFDIQGINKMRTQSTKHTIFTEQFFVKIMKSMRVINHHQRWWL